MTEPGPSSSTAPTTSAAEILVTPAVTSRENARLARCVLITYPGHVVNVDKAIDRLGGLQHIVDRHYSTGTLHCQMTESVTSMEDPRIRSVAGILQHKGVVAHRVPASQSGHVTLLVKARRKKGTTKVDMSIMGYVHSKYEFRAMADYAYLPIRRVCDEEIIADATEECAPAKRPKGDEVYEDLTSRLIPMDIGTALNWWSQSKTGGVLSLIHDETLFPAPDDPSGVEYSPSPLLSRYSFSSQYMLTTNTMSQEAIEKAVKDRSKRNQVPENSIGLCARASRKGYTIYVEGDEAEYPKEPKREAVVDADHRDDRMHHRVIQLFDKQRPIWTRAAVHFHVKCTDQVLKVLLPKYAFYISSGPFGRLWCRFGYDPRLADPKEARLYQIVGVTFRRDARLVCEPPPGRLAFGTTSKGQPAKQHPDNGNVPKSPGAQKTEAVYVYRSGVRPVARQVWYCLQDIHLPIVTNIIDSQPTSYNSRLGFLPAGMIDKIRTSIKEDLRASCSLPVDQVDDDDVDDDELSPA